ncbi:ABC transporter family protein, partial [Vibrio parahaemolyticus V-223/04]
FQVNLKRKAAISPIRKA